MVHHETDRPVIETDVFLWEYADHLKVDEATRRIEMSELLSTHGRRFRTDTRGVVRIPVPRISSWIWAKSGDAEGLLRVEEQGPRPDTLRLRVAERCTVRTRGPDGAPLAGVPVFVAIRNSKTFVVLWDGLTNEAGNAGFRDLSARAHEKTGMAAQDTGGTLVVGTRIPFSPPVSAEFSDALPREGVDLTLPATSSLEVRVRRPDGELLHESAVVRIRPDSPDGQTPSLRIEATDGSAHVAHVGSGVRLRIEAQDSAGLWGPGAAVIDTAPAGGIDLTLEPRRPMVRVALIRADGAPVARTRIYAVAEPESALSRLHARGGALSTDDDGELHLPLDEPLPAGSEGTLHLYADSPDGTPLRAVVPVPAADDRGVSDSGTHVLEPMPIAVAGHVVDQDGTPVPGAQVRLTTHVPGFVFYAPTVEVRSDESGSFTLRCPELHGDVELLVLHPDFAPSEGAAFAFGSKDVQVRMASVPLLTGTIVGADGIDLQHIQFYAVGLHGRRHRLTPRWTGATSFEMNAATEFGSSVELRLPGIGEPVAILGGRQTTRNDAESTQVDLRSIRRFVVRIEGPNEAELRDLVARVHPVGTDQAPVEVRPGALGGLLFYGSAEAMEVEIAVQGYAPVSQRLEPGESVVLVNEPAYRITIACKLSFGVSSAALVMFPLVEHLESGASVQPDLSRAAGAALERYRIRDGRTWAVQVRVPKPGEYAVRLRLGRYRARLDGNEVLETIELDGATPASVHVKSEREIQTFWITVTGDQIEATHRRLE